MPNIHVPPLGRLARIADYCMVPLMYLVSGTLSESPQKTHKWNNKKLTHADVRHLSFLQMVQSVGVPASQRWFGKIPLFHMPIFGGWKRYVLLSPIAERNIVWHVGWIAGDVIGVSRISCTGPVRVLIGPSVVAHFGLDTDGRQVPVVKIGEGSIGDGSPFGRFPLF